MWASEESEGLAVAGSFHIHSLGFGQTRFVVVAMVAETQSAAIVLVGRIQLRLVGSEIVADIHLSGIAVEEM